MCVCQKSGAHAFGSVSDTRDTQGGENVDTPIGQFLLIGNFRRRLDGTYLYEMWNVSQPRRSDGISRHPKSGFVSGTK